MNKLTDTPREIKEALRIRGLELEDLRKLSKMGEGPFKDVMNGTRIMPDFMIMRLAEFTNTVSKDWKNLQNKEIYENKFEIGERGLVL